MEVLLIVMAPPAPNADLGLDTIAEPFQPHPRRGASRIERWDGCYPRASRCGRMRLLSAHLATHLHPGGHSVQNLAARMVTEPPEATFLHRSAPDDIVGSIIRSECCRLERQLPGGFAPAEECRLFAAHCSC